MTAPAVITQAAQDDLVAQLRWIGPDNIERTRALREAVRDAAQLLGARPQVGRTRPDLLPPSFRFWSLRRFQLILVYEASPVPPRIARIVSTSQDLWPLLASIRPA